MAEQTADGAAAAMWLGGDDCTFRDALVLGADVREQAANVLPSLGRRDATRHFPASMSDALSLVHAREDAKRKNTTSKMAKGKHKSLVASHIGTDTHFPGAKEGGGDASAFWMYLEVRWKPWCSCRVCNQIIPFLA